MKWKLWAYLRAISHIPLIQESPSVQHLYTRSCNKALVILVSMSQWPLIVSSHQCVPSFNDRWPPQYPGPANKSLIDLFTYKCSVAIWSALAMTPSSLKWTNGLLSFSTGWRKDLEHCHKFVLNCPYTETQGCTPNLTRVKLLNMSFPGTIHRQPFLCHLLERSQDWDRDLNCHSLELHN